jgi:hypothetical protein
VTRRLAGALLSASLFLAAHAHAQGPIVLIVDPGELRVNVPQLSTAIQTAVGRPLVRMTDDEARSAQGRLTIAYQSPDRWVLRYEAAGSVAWVTDRIRRPGELRTRLASLSHDLVASVDTPAQRAPSRSSGANWDDDAVILALQNEIVDPFEGEPVRPPRPVSVLWSEVVDPFVDRPSRAPIAEVWSEVLDPWALPHH